MVPPRPKGDRIGAGDIVGLIRQMVAKVTTSAADMGSLKKTQEQILKTQVVHGTALTELMATAATKAAVTEGVTVIAGKIDAIDQRHSAALAAVRQDLRGLDGRLGTVEGHLAAVDRRLETMDGRFDTVESRLGAVEGRIGDVEGRLEAMDQKHTASFDAIAAGQGKLQDAHAILMQNQLDMNRKLDAILNHLGAKQ